MIKFHIKNFKNLIKPQAILGILLVTAGIVILLHSTYQCPIDLLLGISCPGCGMTRATFCALRFDFAKAFYYHPLWWLVHLFIITTILEFFHILEIDSSLHHKYIITVVTLIITVYIIRLLTGDDIVNIHFEKSLLYKLLNGII